MADRKDEKAYDASGNVASTSSAPSEETKKSREDTLAAAKYNPALRGKPMSQEEVKAAGGLGAIAAAAKKKKSAAAQADALEKKN